MPHPSLRRLAVAVAAAVVLSSIPTLAQPRPFEAPARAVNAPQDFVPPTLGLTFNDAAQAPGKTLVAGVTVTNPGGGPLVDFYFVIVLPDGTTAVSAGPGVGARIGTLANLRSLVPVARSISLASAFPFEAPAFFSYTFTGPEPQGTYTVYFVALVAGALNDGVLGGGDLVASVSRTFTVGPNGAPQTDTTRTVAATIAPTGGSVQTSTASGIGLRLAVPAGGLNSATPITIAPLTAFNDLATGPLVAGVRAEPAGLRFNTPATLSITLPPGFQVPAFGLKGFVADTDGSHLEVVPVSIVGNVATLQVPHFSVAGIGLNNFSVAVACGNIGTDSPQAQIACAALRPLYQAETRRLAAEGGSLSAAFTSAWRSIMQTWLELGIQPRFTAARFPIGDAASDMRAAGREWRSFLIVYTDLFALEDRSNALTLQPFGLLIDQLQNQLVRDLPVTIAAVNRDCLADKANVLDYVSDVGTLVGIWEDQFVGPAPFAVAYCVGIDISAAPVPVLTPGTTALMPLDIRLRFSDGVDLPPGIPLSVVITATDATVSPAGGILSTPISTTVSIAPAATASTITISVAVAAVGALEGLNRLPARTATVFAGAVRFDFGALDANARLVDTIGSSVTVRDVRNTFESGERSAVTLPTTVVGAAGAGYTARGSAAVSRTITGAAGGLVVSLAATTAASITLDGAPPINADVIAGTSDAYSVFLRVPFDVTPAAISNGTLFITPAGGSRIAATPGVPIRLPAGRNGVIFDAGIRRQYQGLVAGQPMVGQTAGSHSYSLVFSVVP